MKPIYCDNHVLVLEKPAGLSTHPEFHEIAKSYIKEAFNKPGNVFLEPVHQLDKPVSGLLLFARTSKALTRLNEAMRERLITKRYRARVEGVVPPQGTLEHTLLHGEFRALVDPKGKQAILHYTRLDVTDNTSLVEIELVTGRYHQIRAQFSAIGHPVVGDTKYGGQPARSVHLHHYYLKFPHPTTKEAIECKSDGSHIDLNP